MKLLRDLVHFLQFTFAVVATCGLVVGAAMVGQNWLGRPEEPVATPSPPDTTATGRPVPSPLAPLPLRSPSSLPLPPWSPSLSPSPDLPEQTPAAPSGPPEPVAAKPRPLYGHLPYAVVNPKELVIAGDYYGRQERLHKDAAAAFGKLLAAARQQQIPLKIASGFRDQKRQQALFARQIKRKGSKTAAAKWSAPPGYSEHHMGYALDVGDGQNTDFTLAFAKTKTYQWMLKHAAEFGFELSFPENNAQGFEPWHWWFIGNDRAKALFQAAQEPSQTVN